MNATTTTNTDNKTITIKFEIDQNELWSSVFGSSPFSFGYHFTECDYLGDTQWDKVGKVRIKGYNENDKLVTKTIGIKELANALPIANQQVYMDLFNFDNYDAICADAILQVAVFGKVIYG